MRLLGEGSAKAVYAAFRLVGVSGDELTAEVRVLLERVKVTLPGEAVT